MRIEYIIISFIILVIMLLIAFAMLGGVKEGLAFILTFFK